MMSRIKSALELALERTDDVKIDKEALRRNDSISIGKNLAGRYLDSPGENPFESKLKKLKGSELTWIREGIITTFLANINLPVSETALSSFNIVADGLKALAGDSSGSKKLDHLINHFQELFKQYLESLNQLENNLRSQWEPRLRQKEDLLRKQTGQSFKLTPEQYPEFTKTYSEQIASIHAQYNEVVAQGKQEIRKIFNVIRKDNSDKG